MIDIVIPKRNEEELLEMALKLGWTGLCFAYPDQREIPKMPAGCYSALLNKSGKADLVIFDQDAREVLEKKQCDLLFDMEKSPKQDVLQTNSGLNHVFAKLASDKRKIICFNFSRLLKDRREIILRRMKQNIKLCQKYKAEMAIASFATTPEELRNPSDIESLFRLLGMKNPKKALNAVEERINLNLKKRKGIVLKEGIERV